MNTLRDAEEKYCRNIRSLADARKDDRYAGLAYAIEI
jgi:hypothetical protein